MTDEVKRGSSGGKQRAENLTKEQRKEIASTAAKARWDKIRRTKENANTPFPESYVSPNPEIVSMPTAAPETIQATQQSSKARPTVKRRARVPKEFGAAHSYAEKRLAEAIRERAESAGRVAALNAEIPSLVQIIKALKSTEISINPQAFQTVDPSINYPSVGMNPMTVPQQSVVIVPPVPVAHGGAIGGDFGSEKELPEDYFLRGGDGSSGTKWKLD